MNGELLQIARITYYVNYSLRNNAVAEFKHSPYEGAINFVLDHKKSFSDTENETIYGVEEWVRTLIGQGLKKAVLFVSVSDNPSYAGFSNTGSKCMITEFLDGTSSSWYPRWEFDRAKTMWNVQYFQLSCGPAPDDPRLFVNNLEEFKDVLQKIEAFAREINNETFAKIFKESYGYLVNEDESGDAVYMRDNFPGIGNSALRMLTAASGADVFGGMGSWNDIGYEADKDEEYQRLSQMLYAQVQKAVMFAVNT